MTSKFGWLQAPATKCERYEAGTQDFGAISFERMILPHFAREVTATPIHRPGMGKRPVCPPGPLVLSPWSLSKRRTAPCASRSIATPTSDASISACLPNVDTVAPSSPSPAILPRPATGSSASSNLIGLRCKTEFRPGTGKRETRLALLQRTTGERGLGVNAKPSTNMLMPAVRANTWLTTKPQARANGR